MRQVEVNEINKLPRDNLRKIWYTISNFCPATFKVHKIHKLYTNKRCTHELYNAAHLHARLHFLLLITRYTYTHHAFHVRKNQRFKLQKCS